MNTPVIAVSASIDESGQSDEDWLYLLNRNYAAAITGAGGLPVLVTTMDADAVAESCDGLLLTGGWLLRSVVRPEYDVPPASDSEHLAHMEAVRLPYDVALYRAFRAVNKPILGICQGMLTINVAEGGVNSYDLPGDIGTEHGGGVSHLIQTEPGSRIRDWCGGSVLVNSFHDHYVKTLAPGLRITAASIPDGVPEALEFTESGQQLVLGVQWHPERMRGDNRVPSDGPDMSDLFARFVRVAASGGARE